MTTVIVLLLVVTGLLGLIAWDPAGLRPRPTRRTLAVALAPYHLEVYVPRHRANLPCTAPQE